MYRLTIDRMVLETARKFGPRIALNFPKRDGSSEGYTYGELAKRMEWIARGLIVEGLKPGDRIAILSNNSPTWGVAALAALRAGAVLVPVDAKATRKELTRLLEHSGASRLMVSKACFEKLKVIPAVEKIYFLDGDREGARHSALNQLAELGSKHPPIVQPLRNADDLALIVYTSGTTGDPKGVMLSHRNVLSNMEMILNRLQANETDAFTSILPLSHMLEFTCGFCLPLALGSSIHYVGSFNPADIVRVMQTSESTIMVAVPRLFQAMWRKFQDHVQGLSPSKAKAADLFQSWTRRAPFLGKYLFRSLHQKFGGKIRFWVSGGAALDPEIARGFASVGIPLLNGYGLTETAPVLSVNCLDSNQPETVGRPLPGVEVRIFDADEAGVGQVAARGANVFQGYFRNKKATEEAFRDGWYLTGDLGILTPDGNLELKGRSKNLIVTPNGKNIHPEEVEEYLRRSRLFDEVAVVGMPEGKGQGEVVTAVVHPSEALKGLSPAEIEKQALKEVRNLTREISDFKRPRRVLVRTQELPKTHTMKIKRKALLQELTRGSAPAKSGRVRAS